MSNLELAKTGDTKAFEELINNVKFKLYKTGMSILKNDDDTCDALQETLISAYKNLSSLKEENYFTTWIIRIMINKCYDIIKKNKKITYINQKIEIEDTGYYERYEIESSLEKHLNKLDEDLRTIVVLYYYDELKVGEISDILNIPEGTVKSRLARAREKLYSNLKEEEV